ncbi:hypothetical protein B0A55_06582 [Friedmanniomyces simplex]|uniref:Methyltransferase domain-containing protein n=1 Tax=Friedmanniomyces simplex TaxID=329884 RepID=A0A4U0XE17_9PEZI|nr:hypothetical protein B0A55_06582 [Friedmanniomyces simplex]
MSQTESNDHYPMPRDTSETARLNAQHKCLVGAFGFHIHPSIPVASEERKLRVADVACGSGIWLTEIATQYPHAQCDGFDISDKQFPAASDLQSSFGDRVHFHAQDATVEGGYGKDFAGHFDIVAVRLLHISIAGAQWTRAVQNAIALLKPGGYLQWIDWDPHSAHLVQSRPLVAHVAMDQLLGIFKQFLSTMDTGATARLPQEMREGGLMDVRSELFALDADPGWREHFLWTITTVMPDVLAKRAGLMPGGAGDGKDWARLKAVAQEEGKQEGLWVRTEIWCHVGKKPM